MFMHLAELCFKHFCILHLCMVLVAVKYVGNVVQVEEDMSQGYPMTSKIMYVLHANKHGCKLQARSGLRTAVCWLPSCH